MADRPVDTLALRGWLSRIEAGDPAARDELLRGVAGRLERLARKMLRQFPQVRRWAQTDDVLQGAALRLLRALGEVRPANTREFFGLAALQLRRELLDLAKHFYGPHGAGANHASQAPGDGPPGQAREPADRRGDAEELERWCAFHREVERLPAEEREVVGLVFYHGWTRAQVAELFQVAERTVRRRWEDAMVKLHAALNAGRGG
jgi:RNA polymerase sigma-70 factor (ECF subfamily)